MIVFDIDETLYLRSELYLKTYREFFGGRLGLDEQLLEERNRIRKEEAFQMRAEGKISMEEMLILRTTLTYRDLGVELSPETALAFEQLYAKNQNEIDPIPVYKDLLESLHQRGCPVGVLTNGPSDRQRGKIQAMGLWKYFREENVLASGDIGIIKPDPRIFRAFEEKTGLPPDKLWMVGDSFESDIAGASDAGWHTVWINRKQEKPAGYADVKIDFESTSDDEICAFLTGDGSVS